MIACDRCRKRVETTGDMNYTWRHWNDIEMFAPTRELCDECYRSWNVLWDKLIADLKVSARQESDRRMAEWMSSRDVTHDPWSEVPNES